MQEASPLAHIVFNTNLRILEAISANVIADLTLSAPPGSPAESSIYYVLPTGTGDWAGHDDELAIYIQGLWYFVPLFDGQSWVIATSGTAMTWDGATWS